MARYQERPVRQDFCDKNAHGGALHRCLHGVRHLIEDHVEAAGLPLLVKVLGCDYNAVFVERPWEMEDEYEAC